MKLTNIALLALKGSDREVRQKIAAAIGVSESAVYKFIQNNDDNLTKAASLKIIRELTGLSDADILDSTEVPA
jgi:hypothetical protein